MIRSALTAAACLATAPALAEPPRTTGVVCYEGNPGLGTWLKVDTYNTYAVHIGIGTDNPALRRALFPDLPLTDENVGVWLAVSGNDCEIDGKRGLISCKSDHVFTASASVSYYVEPDGIDVQRDLMLSHFALAVQTGKDGAPELSVSLEGEERGRKVSLSETHTFSALWPEPSSSPDTHPYDGCARLVDVHP